MARITDSMLLRSAISDVSRQKVRLADIQEKASNAQLLNRPSDDPAMASAAILLRAGQDATGQYQRNVDSASHDVGVLDAVLGDAVNLLILAQTTAVEGATDTQDDESRLILAGEIESIFEQLAGVGNAKSGDAYVFAGFASTTQPFVASGSFGAGLPSPTVSFAGDSNEIQIAIDDGVFAQTSLDGARVFLGDADGDGATDAGAEDAFQLLADLRDALVANDQVAIAATIDRFDVALAGLNAERASVGATGAQLIEMASRLADRGLEYEARLADVEGQDVAAIFSDLVNQENALLASLEVAARVMQNTLLDFLR